MNTEKVEVSSECPSSTKKKDDHVGVSLGG